MLGVTAPAIGPLDEAHVGRLLAEGTERDWLDFKTDVDLTTAAGAAEVAKDIGAMSIAGGYIIVGAHDNGAPTGQPITKPQCYDTAALGPIIAKYLERAQVNGVRITIDSQEFGVICVRPHPDGFAIFSREGAYTENGKPRTAFARGQVWARHNTASEPWRQSDVEAIRRQLGRRTDAVAGAAQRARSATERLLESLQRAGQTYLVVSLASTTTVNLPAGTSLVTLATDVALAAAAREFTLGVAGNPNWTRGLHASVGAGKAVITDLQLPATPEWRAELGRDGGGASAVRVGRAEGGAVEGWTSVFQDRLEVELANQVDLLLQWALAARAAGDLHLEASLYPAHADGGLGEATFDELPMVLTRDPHVEDNRIDYEPRWQAGEIPRATVTMDWDQATAEPHGPLRLAYPVLLDLLTSAGVAETHLVKGGTLDPTLAVIPGPKRRLQERARERGVLTPDARLL